MFRPIGLCLKVLSFAVLLMFVARPSYASLVGSEVYCENSSHWVCTPAIAVVGEGVEFRLVSPFSGDAAFAIDIDEDGVQFKHLRQASYVYSGSHVVSLIGLRWKSPTSGESVITEDLEIRNFSPTNVIGVEQSDVSLTGDTMTIDYGFSRWDREPNNAPSLIDFDLVIRPIRYIDGASVLLPYSNPYEPVALLRILRKFQPQVEIRDPGTNEALNFIPFFWSDWTPVAMAVIDANGDGAEDVAVLAHDKNTGVIKIQVRDALTDEKVSQMQVLTPEWIPQDMFIVDGNADGKQDLAVIAVHSVSEEAVTIIKDVNTGARISRLPLSTGNH